jgi:cell division protein FtsN
MLVGVFIGLVLGLALAAGVAWYFMKSGNPYQPTVAGRESPREPGKAARPETAPPVPDKPRFDFYRILPGADEPKVPSKAAERTATDRATLDNAVPGKAAPSAEVHVAPGAGERFWLQAGSFAGEADAENLKAQLALSGWEAVIQSASIPDKGVRYRVRLGPFDNTDQLNRTKAELARRGFDVAVIKY